MQDLAAGNHRTDRLQVAGCAAVHRGNHAGDFGIWRSGKRSGDRYVLRQSIRRVHHSGYITGLTDQRVSIVSGRLKTWCSRRRSSAGEFSYELIEAVSSVPRAALPADLGRLVQSDLLEQRGTPPQSRYHLQACTDSRRSLTVGHENEKARAAPTPRRGVHKPVSSRSSLTSPNCWRTTTRKQSSRSGARLLAPRRRSRGGEIGLR